MNRDSKLCGLFLDLDGTLADSLSIMYEVYEQFLQKFCFKGNPQEFSQLNGMPLSKIIKVLKIKYKLIPDIINLQSAYEALIQEAYVNVTPNHGAEKLLKVATKKNIKISVVTSASKMNVQSWLKRTHLNQYISIIVGCDSVVNGKPHPSPYLKAMELTGCNASHSLAVEDSLIGATSALAAKLETYILRSKTADKIKS
jgi:HAD superfamily hydrolase (TIGR01509 family)